MHGLTLDSYDNLVGMIYRAGCDPSRWSDFIGALDAHIDGAHLSIYGHDMKAETPLLYQMTRYSDEQHETYEAHYSALNPFLPALMRAPVMDIRYSESWVPRDELLKSEFYNDWLGSEADIGSGGGGVLFNDDGRLLILSGQVRFRDEDHKTPKLIETLRLLAPHVRRAFEMQRALRSQSVELGRYRAALDRVRNSVFLMNARGQVVHANAAAEAALARNGAIWRNADGTLVFRDNDANIALSQALGRVARRDHRPGPAQFAVKMDEKLSVAASLDPFGPERLDALARLLPPENADPVAMLVLIDAELDLGTAVQRLGMLCNLTPAETRLAFALAAGNTPQEIADDRGVSLNTVRSQLKAIYVKAGVKRQSQLVALVHGLVD